MGIPLDIADCIHLLAADPFALMTGQVLRPNGGVPMH
jgi:hypothetical protein